MDPGADEQSGESPPTPGSPAEQGPPPPMVEPPAADALPPVTEPPAATPGPPAKRKRWIPRQIKWTITIVALFFVLEYLLLPEIASARKSLNLLGEVNVFWLILGVLLEFGALAAYAELSHTVLTPDSPHRFQLLPGQHVEPGRQPRPARRHRARLGRRLPAADRARGPRQRRRVRSRHPGRRFGGGPQRASSGSPCSSPSRSTATTRSTAFAAIAGVILISLFAGTVLLLTRGKHSAADYLHRLAAHLPFINPDRISTLVQSIADRLVILLRDRALLVHALEWAAAQLDPRRGVALGLHLRLRPRGLPDRPARRLRPGQHPGGHPDHARRPRRRRGRPDPDAGRLRHAEGHGHPRRPVVPARQLLAADPARRGRLPVAALRPARPSATGAGRRQRVNGRPSGTSGGLGAAPAPTPETWAAGRPSRRPAARRTSGARPGGARPPGAAGPARRRAPSAAAASRCPASSAPVATAGPSRASTSWCRR